MAGSDKEHTQRRRTFITKMAKKLSAVFNNYSPPLIALWLFKGNFVQANTVSSIAIV